jgi:lipid A ethanolaminephosphotransferase
MFAPDSQRHVPVIMWFGTTFDDIDIPELIENRHKRYTHDNIFHTVLGFMEVQTSIHNKDLDMLNGLVTEKYE